MKIIDLLNIWVNNKDKLPKKIKIKNKIFEYREFGDLYVTSDKSCFLITDYLDSIGKLNAEVEIIEENKTIEELKKISYDEFKYTDNKHRFDLTNIEYDKINELIRAVNKINKESDK